MRKMPFARRIRRLRRMLKMSQFDLAHRLGVVEATVKRWEAGTAEPKSDAVLRAVEALEVAVRQRRDGDDEV